MRVNLGIFSLRNLMTKQDCLQDDENKVGWVEMAAAALLYLPISLLTRMVAEEAVA